MDEPRPRIVKNNQLGIRKKYSDKLIRRTLEVWQPRTSHRLTEGDAKVMLDNATDLFRLLMKWDREGCKNKDTDTENSK